MRTLFIWQNTEKRKERKDVTNRVSDHSIEISRLGRTVMALRSLHHQ
jgi:hypothetical protein